MHSHIVPNKFRKFLENNYSETAKLKAKQGRIFHRLVTGLQIAINKNEIMRFLTLTTAPNAKRDIKKSFDVLRKRIMRANRWKDGFSGFKFNKYFCLRTTEGLGVLHIVFWGKFIPIQWLKKNWLDIHGAYEVDIREVKTKKKKANGIVNYLITNYLTTQPIKRMSYGWGWAWLGFCKAWKNVKQVYSDLRHTSTYVKLGSKITDIKTYFRDTRRSHYITAWNSILWNPPKSSRMKKLTDRYKIRVARYKVKNMIILNA